MNEIEQKLREALKVCMTTLENVAHDEESHHAPFARVAGSLARETLSLPTDGDLSKDWESGTLRKLADEIKNRYFKTELAIGKIVTHPTDGRVRITGGYFFDPTYGRLSNHWEWIKLDENDDPMGEPKSGYGWM